MAAKVGIYDSEIISHLKNLLKLNDGAHFYPVEMHCHTPGSVNDYSICGIKYDDVMFEVLETEAKKLGILPKDMMFKNTEQTEQEQREWITPAIIVARAYNRNIRVMIITDHDSIAWYEKVKSVVSNVRKSLKTDYKLIVLPGVEITAYSGFHVIAVVEPSNYDALKMYLDVLRYRHKIKKPASIDEIINEVVDNLDGTIYFPHVDAYDAINKADIKRTIFANNKVSAVAFKNAKKEIEIKSLINTKEYKRENEPAFVRDSDAHCPEEIGDRPIWLKMTHPSYSGFIHALGEPELRVLKEPPQSPSYPYILGMAFLDSPVCEYRDKWYYFRFNASLNCLIGARGTGKSTIINWITNTMEQMLDHGKQRSWYGSFGRILIFLKNDSNTYVVDINPLVPTVNEINGERPVGISHWIEIRHIKSNGKTVLVHNKTEFLNKFRSETFKQTAVETLASNQGRLHDSFLRFLQQDSLRWAEYTKAYGNVSFQIIDALSKAGYDLDRNQPAKFIENVQRVFSDYICALNKAKDIEEEFASNLNRTVLKNKLRLKIIVENKPQNAFRDLINLLEDNLGTRLPRDACQHIVGSANQLFLKNGLHQGLVDLFKLSEEQLTNEYSLEAYIPSTEMINAGHSSYSVQDIVSFLRDSLILKCNSKQMARILKEVPRLSIEIFHNIRFGQEFEGKEPIFKGLDELSLGQKCVAILAYIIDTADFLGDNRPLIIDQPEDHLDNRYIYDYLVKDIRNIKNKRQIILSTHNPNIPVCADAEQILVMKSDGLRMWVDYSGSLDYREPGTNKEMLLCLQETLEGGRMAFKQRKKKYRL